MHAFLLRLWPQDGPQRLFVGLFALLIIGAAAAALANSPALLVPGLLGLGLLVAFVEWRWLYYALFFTLAFSYPIGLPGGLTMDVPSEPLMLALTACVWGALLLGQGRLPAREWRHPLVVVLALGLLWSAVGIGFSVDTTKSVKYVLAKVWYLTPFVLGTLLVVRRPADVWRLLGVYAAGATLSTLYVISRHATRGFAFDTINWAVKPFYHNHVTVATVQALLLPFVLLGAGAVPRGWMRRAWQASLVVLLFGLCTSYTRASLLALPVAGLYYLVLRWRLTGALLGALALGAGGAAFYFVHENNFMLYAPDFEKTIFNGHNFEKHLEATYKLQDVSGMERVYRWVAAARMVADRPLTGSGPATFYPEYKRYTVRSFRTYVSDNPERSTTHNYFLLQLAEQGVPGFVLFATLVGWALLTAQRLYHRARHRPEVRRVVLAAALSLVVIVFHLTLNELVEVDKIGSVFFVCLALLVRADSWLAEEPGND
ncbi:O-antigen ligase family protein [Hymenobacter caeli]|uniref:O-antigen ligase n=1 Tax=Hymenobacter caeli TaxID=2735894 RepID=A0ABX2FWN2_9BACT|nr:O-antigen ligase family protein [Hymenobacter caeli]NRT21397.1 O-antigen ligase [Hymenobacter caeli]